MSASCATVPCVLITNISRCAVRSTACLSNSVKSLVEAGIKTPCQLKSPMTLATFQCLQMYVAGVADVTLTQRWQLLQQSSCDVVTFRLAVRYSKVLKTTTTRSPYLLQLEAKHKQDTTIIKMFLQDNTIASIDESKL